MWNDPVLLINVPFDGALPDLEFTYLDAKGEVTQRRATPRSLRFMKSGGLGIMSDCHLRGEERCFDITHMQHVRTSGGLRQPFDAVKAIEPFRHRLMALRALNTDGYDAMNTAQGDLRADLEGLQSRILGVAERALELGNHFLKRNTSSIVAHELITASPGQDDVHLDLPPWVLEMHAELSGHELMRVELDRRELCAEMRDLSAAMKPVLTEHGCTHDMHLGVCHTQIHASVHFTSGWMHHAYGTHLFGALKDAAGLSPVDYHNMPLQGYVEVSVG